MAEYIKREEAIDAVNDLAGKASTCSAYEAVAPVVHGRWATHYRSGTPVAEGYVSTCCDMWNKSKRNYCPNCGAKMDGGEGNEAD